MQSPSVVVHRHEPAGEAASLRAELEQIRSALMESRRLRSVLQRDLAQAHANLAEYRKTAARLECALARIARGSCIHCEADEVAVAALS